MYTMPLYYTSTLYTFSVHHQHISTPAHHQHTIHIHHTHYSVDQSEPVADPCLVLDEVVLQVQGLECAAQAALHGILQRRRALRADEVADQVQRVERPAPPALQRRRERRRARVPEVVAPEV